MRRLIICMAVLFSFFGVLPARAGTYLLTQTFNDPTPTNGDVFGNSVAIDGDNVLIGASCDDTNGINVGQAHLFDTATGNLMHTFNDPTVSTTDHFGISLAIDGHNVFIGAGGHGSYGQAHLFTAPDPATLGDTNDDDIIDDLDLANLVAQFGGPPGDDSADFNSDGRVDLENFAIQRDNFGFGVVTAPGVELGATIPEPATLSLLALLAMSLPKRGGLVMLRRRNRGDQA